MQLTLTRVEEDCQEFAVRLFDFEISIRPRRQLITESGILKRSGRCWQIVCKEWELMILTRK